MSRKIPIVTKFRLGVALALTAGVIAACDSGNSPTSPSSPGTVPRVTISSTGFSATEVRISAGGRVEFVNNDSVTRQVNSNPFPTHTDCPPINEVDVLNPGQSKMTGVLSLAGTCGFHDHVAEGAQGFVGVILIGENASSDDPPPDGY